MNVDIAALRAIERDKDIPFETVIEAIETALLTAYRHTDGHQPHARIDIDRKTGLVRVMAAGDSPRTALDTEWDDTPEGFGRIAATTARQVIVQRLRDAEHERTYGEFAAKEGEIVAGVVQRDARANARGVVIVRCGGRPRACCRRPSRCRVRTTRTASGIRCYVVGVTRGMRGTQITLSRTHPNLVRKLFALEVPEIVDGSVEIVAVAREAGHRSKIAVRSTVPGVNPKGACIGPVGRAGARRDERAGRREDRHHRLVRRPGHVRRQRAVPVEGGLGHGRSTSAPAPPGSSCPDFQLSLAIGKEGQNARLAARLTGWRIDIRSDADPARRRRRPGVGVGPAEPARGCRARPAGASRESRGRRPALHSEDGPGVRAGRRLVRDSPLRSDRLRSATGPVRTCVGCRSRAAAGGLLRVVVVDGVVAPDPRRRLPGRGAWLHPAPECLDRAERRSAFPRALRVPGPLDDRSRCGAHLVAQNGARDTPGSGTPGSKVDPS